MSQMTTNHAASSKTECKDQPLLFQDLGARKVVADFSGGYLSSDGGALLLRQIDRGLGVTRQLAAGFRDQRNPVFVEHRLEELLSQRLYALALGYEDLNDHHQLRRDPLLAVGAGKLDPLGQQRTDDQYGCALASPSTLNRLELGNNRKSRCHKISYDPQAIAQCVLGLAVRALPKWSRQIVLDLDATGDLVHGLQEGRHFNAYYGDYCYLPLYIVAGEVILWAQLRSSAQGAAEGAVAALEQVLRAVRQRCKRARIVVRADSGFCREDILRWCEDKGVSYCIGFARNDKLVGMIERERKEAAALKLQAEGSVRVYGNIWYRAKSWRRARRVVAKAEVTKEGENPRFVVTNLPVKECAAPRLYEQVYCARGQMENVLKQVLLDMAADRTSTHHLASNQLRLWLSTLAYLLLERMRALTLRGTELARATVGTIRLKLLKVAAVVSVSVRRVHVQLSSAWPWQHLFAACAGRLAALRL